MRSLEQLLDEAANLVVPPRSPADRQAFGRWLADSLTVLKKPRDSFDIPREDVDAMIDRESHGTAKGDRVDLHAAVVDLLDRSANATPVVRRDATQRAEEVVAGRARLAAFFSPGDDLRSAILAVIRGAREEILVQAWNLSCSVIGEALVNSKAPRVEVAVSAPAGETLPAALRQLCTHAHIQVLHGSDPRQKNHNKTMVIDRRLLLTGSVNFNFNSGKHDENLLVTTDAEMVAAYRKDFESKRARLVRAPK